MNQLKNIKPISVSQQRGATLLEVMISVFIMAFGIMALMLAQIKSLGSVREAEMQTRVAQATQNLAEGMLSNPDVRMVASSPFASVTYSDYDGSKSLTPATAGSVTSLDVCGEAGATRDQLITCQIGVFDSDLIRALPNATVINYTISTNGTGVTTVQVNWTESNGSFVVIYNFFNGNFT